MVNIVSATYSDISTIERLAYEIWHLHYPGIISLEQIDYMLHAHYSQAAIEKSLKEGVLWFLVENEAEISGFFSIAYCHKTLWKLEKIYIHPKANNQGLGRISINFIKNLLKEKGATTLTLNVNRKNRNSIEAYRKFGFKQIREEDNYLDRFLLDDYVMELDLSVSISNTTSLK